MYADSKPCEVCGSEVELEGDPDPKVTDPDGPLDDRVCTNPECPTNRGGSDAPTP